MMQKNGQPTPLDNIPIIEDYIEKWFYDTYSRLKNLSSFEYHITINDFVNYFSIYPIPFSKTFVISIIKKIDTKVIKHNDKIRKSKEKKKVN